MKRADERPHVRTAEIENLRSAASPRAWLLKDRKNDLSFSSILAFLIQIWFNRSMISSNVTKSFRTTAVVGAGALMACSVPFSLANAQSTPQTVELIPGQTCAPSEVIRASLRAQGQVPIIIANRDIPSQPRNFFSADANLSTGYQLEESNGTMCVKGKYRDVRLNNNPSVSIPDWAPIAPVNSPFNRFLEQERSQFNARVIFGAVAVNQNGQATSKVVVTMGNAGTRQYVSNQGAAVAGYNNGEYGVAAGLVNITLDPNFTTLAMANAPR